MNSYIFGIVLSIFILCVCSIGLFILAYDCIYEYVSYELDHCNYFGEENEKD